MSKLPLSFMSIAKDPKMFLAFGFGSGLAPIMPGTAGTLAAIPLYLLFAQLPTLMFAGIIIASGIYGIYLCRYASNTLGVPDYKGIVWDEFVGFWITMLAIPVQWEFILIGFVLFRFFDMVKPWPISWIDKHIHGGSGIMLDDIIAGIAANIGLQIIIWQLW